MSSSSYLAKKRKPELQELADSFGLKSNDSLKKAELESSIEEYMKSNQSSLSSDSRYAPFYKPRRSESSPVKREVASFASDVETKARVTKRRATKAADEIASAVAAAATSDESDADVAATRSSPTTALAARTPRSAASTLSFAHSVPLPPSPAVVADAIDRRTQQLRRRVSETVSSSGALEYAEAARGALSSAVSVEALIILFEALFLRREVLADRHAFTLPAVAALGTRARAVRVPDLFLLLTASFWAPAGLWAATSLALPLVAGYFVNLTRATHARSTRSHAAVEYAYRVDPLTFNVAKALLTYVVYAQDRTFGGLVDLESVARINSALYGGWQGVLVGCGVGALMTLYEAMLKK